MDIALGNCEWPDPHPPHLWADEIKFPTGDSKIKVFGCSGTLEEDI